MIKYVYGLEKEDPLFVSKRGKRITSRQVENVIKQLRQDSEIDVAMTPHTLDIALLLGYIDSLRNVILFLDWNLI